MEVKAEARYQRISSLKVKRILSLIKLKPAAAALQILNFMPQSAAKYIYEVLKSAVANAKNNYKLKEADLVVSRVCVGRATPFIRQRARARGRASVIKKKTSHITIYVKVKEEN